VWSGDWGIRTPAVGAVLAPNTRECGAEIGGFEPRLWALCLHPTRASVERRMGDSNPGCGRCACTQHAGVCGGEWGIRTPEGLHPTRFPSVRHRPLGEFSWPVAALSRRRPT